MSSEAELAVTFAQNQPQYKPYSLKLAGLRTVEDLRKAISGRFYLPPNSVTIKYEQRILDDDSVLIANLLITKKSQITVIIIEPVQSPIPGAKPLIIGGIDFTNVREIQQLLGNKNEERRAVAPKKEKEKDKEIDFKERYKSELVQLKEQLSQMGFEKEEDDLIVLLINANGRVDRAMEAVLDAS